MEAKLDTPFTLPFSCFVHLKIDGEVCNRLKMGVKVNPIQKKGDWIKITWRAGKKKGWIKLIDKN
jgi:hypothetical protein